MKKINYVIGLILLFITHLGIAAPQLITLQKGDKTISVFGTIHITKNEFFPLPDNVTNALRKADALAVEIDMTDSKTQSEMMQYMLGKGMLSSINLDTALSADEKAIIKNTLGQAANGMMKMRSWILASAILVARAKQLGFIDKSVDMYLTELAKSQKKSVLALEKMSEQTDVFDRLSAKEELNFLRDALNTDKEFQQTLQQTAQVWQKNDENTAQTLLGEVKEKMPNLYQAIFTRRNITMTKRIEKFNQQYPHLMVAIGALHLYGDNNVIQQLKDNGYVVK